jgi:hypothetical protein
MKANGKAPTRRPIEREYLATLNAVVSLDTWKTICQKAVDEALEGDAKARDWLAKWLMTFETRPLTVLAAEESMYMGSSQATLHEIDELTEKLTDQAAMARMERMSRGSFM